MGELGLNKIFGALLAAALAVMGLQWISDIVFPEPGHGGGHHGDDHHEEKSLNEQLAERYAYYVEVAESGGGAVVEEVFDLGLALVNADPARGETAFRGKCATCHTVDDGGANGTGPNLYNIMGAAKQHAPGFSYSGVLADIGGEWTYEAMNDWLENPGSYARGTSMAFAGLRRDDERANVIAYLTQYTPNPPAFPDPLPVGGEEVLEEAEALVETATPAAAEGGEAPAEEAVAAPAEPAAATPTVDDLVEAVPGVDEAAEAAGERLETLVEGAEDTAADAVDQAEGAVDGE